MTFPLKQKKICGYKYKQFTWYGVFHRGVDYCANKDLLVAPHNGKIIYQGYGYQGGNWLHFWTDNGYLFKFAHLSHFYNEVGEYIKEGEKLAITGNTGALTTSPHLHLEVWKDKQQKHQINPEIYFNNLTSMKITKEELKKLYELIFHREPDKDAYNYVGHDLEFVLNEFQKSKEYKIKKSVIQIIKENFK